MSSLPVARNLLPFNRDMESEIQQFIMRNLLAGKIALGLDDPLFTSGALDSLGYMRLVEYLERNFQISQIGRAHV